MDSKRIEKIKKDLTFLSGNSCFNIECSECEYYIEDTAECKVASCIFEKEALSVIEDLCSEIKILGENCNELAKQRDDFAMQIDKQKMKIDELEFQLKGWSSLDPCETKEGD